MITKLYFILGKFQNFFDCKTLSYMLYLKGPIPSILVDDFKS